MAEKINRQFNPSKNKLINRCVNSGHLVETDLPEDIPSCSTVFVAKLPLYFTNSELFMLFSILGPIRRVRILDSVPNDPCRFGLVTFLDEDKADAAIRIMNGMALGNQFRIFVTKFNIYSRLILFWIPHGATDDNIKECLQMYPRFPADANVVVLGKDHFKQTYPVCFQTSKGAVGSWPIRSFGDGRHPTTGCEILSVEMIPNTVMMNKWLNGKRVSIHEFDIFSKSMDRLITNSKKLDNPIFSPFFDYLLGRYLENGTHNAGESRFLKCMKQTDGEAVNNVSNSQSVAGSSKQMDDPTNKPELYLRLLMFCSPCVSYDEAVRNISTSHSVAGSSKQMDYPINKPELCELTSTDKLNIILNIKDGVISNYKPVYMYIDNLLNEKKESRFLEFIKPKDLN